MQQVYEEWLQNAQQTFCILMVYYSYRHFLKYNMVIILRIN